MSSDHAEPAIAIRVEGVSHGFEQARGRRRLAALSGVSLDVESGAMVCLLGPSGCGKSTLLNVIGGLVAPSTGSVLVAGRPVGGVMPDRIAFVFQESALFPWNTVAENLAIGLEFQRVPKRERAPRVAAALDAVRMREFADFYPGQLSGGMKQRVALARALSQETEILLMDEPFAALDEQTRMVLGEDLSVLLSTARKTIVLVTHSLSEAVFLADRIFVMSARPGTIKAVVDVPEPHPRSPAFSTSPAFNALRAQLYELLHDEIRRTIDAPVAS